MGVKKVRIFDAEPGMVLAKPVVVLHARGRELMAPGSMIEKKHINRLAQWGIDHVYIETLDDDVDEESSVFNESIRFLAKQTYEDAISSLARLSRNLIDEDRCSINQISKSISQILNVIALEDGLLSLLSQIKETEEYIYQHSVDVCVTSLLIGRAMNLSEKNLYDLGAGCLLHDIGLTRYKKSKWDNSMINRAPANIRKHTQLGKDIAMVIAGIDESALDIIEQHHEYFDGTGYPKGLKHDKINPLARVVAIAEAYNTLVSPYDQTKAIDPHRAVTMIIDPSYNRFDPDVIRVFISNMAIYPSGTFVQLNNSMRAVVISSNRDHPLRPRILVLYENQSTPIKPFQVNLSDASYSDWYIDEVVDSANIMSSIHHLVTV